MSLALRPTFSESWYRVVNLRPRLRPTAQISRQYYRGERWYVVRDPAGNQFHRLSDPAYRFVGLLDGSRTVGEAWDLVGGQLADDAPTQPEVLQILSQLFAANLIETDVTPDSAVVLKRQKMHSKRKMQQRLMNLLFPRLPLWDPDTFIKAWMPVIRVMLSWLGAFIWLAVIATAIVMLIPHWDALSGQTANLFSNINPRDAWWLWATFIIIKFIHEMGHAFSCRRFGGEVHEVGIMLLVLVPTPYVDASSAWGFQNKWKRIFVGAGGMIFELFVAAICAFVWIATMGTESLINQLAYNTMLIASVSTILFNANPLLRYDGYYILSDYWEIPNMQRKASEYTLGLIKRHVFRVKQQHPLPPAWQRVQLFTYAIASSCYRVFISLAIAYMLLYTLPEQLKIVGLLMGAGALTMFLVVPLFKTVKYLATDAELHRKRGRAWAFSGTVAAAVVLLIGVINFPVAVRAEGVLEAAERRTIFVQTPGFVEQVLVKDGEWVEPGQVLVVLSNRQEQTKLATDALDLEITKKQIEASRDDPSYATYVNRLERLTRTYQMQKADVEKLVIRAPIAGKVVAPEIHNLKGTFMPSSQEVATIAQASELEAFVVIDQADRARLTTPDGYTTELRVVGNISDTLTVPQSAITIGPAAKREVRSAALTQAAEGAHAADQSDQHGKTLARPQFEARIRFDNTATPGGIPYYPGQRVYVRFKTNDPEPLAVQWYRWFRQLTMNSQQS